VIFLGEILQPGNKKKALVTSTQTLFGKKWPTVTTLQGKKFEVTIFRQ
jgi:hypothetical protein